MRAYLICYVCDQKASTEFYSRVLNLEPSLNVPGMTEFEISSECILGLMPNTGITNLLSALPPPLEGASSAKAELYLLVQDVNAYHRRALDNGAIELDEPKLRDWGHTVAYSLDRDGYVLAFAEVGETNT